MTIQANFPAIKPSLMLDFANTKQLDSRITYSRASTASYYDGVTTSKAEENLLLQSQAFNNVAWSIENATATADSTTAPDGTTTAETITATAATGRRFIYPSATTTTVNSASYVESVYVKAGTHSFVQLTVGSQGAEFADFNLSTGTIGTTGGYGSSASITAVGNGWYRITMPYVAGGTNRDFTLAMVSSSSAARGESWTAVGTETIFVWGAQLEQRSAVSAYTATTTQAITNYIPKLQSAASGVARFDNNPTTGESLGLLIEESRTNLVLRSDDYANASWTKTNSSIDSNTIVAPDGTLTGDKLVEDTATGNHQVQQSGITISASTTYTVTTYAKAAGRDWLFIIDNNNPSSVQAYFNVSTGALGTVGGSATATITSVGNSWYRCSVTFATGPSQSSINLIIRTASANGTTSYTGNGFSGLFLWGVQVEAGAFATSYIPTVASQVTRAADAASMTGTNFSTWYNAGEGTLYSEAKLLAVPGGATYPGIVKISTDSANKIGFWTIPAATSMYFSVSANNTSSADISVAQSPVSSFLKIAGVYKVNDFAASVNASTVGTDTSGIVPVVIKMDIGTYDNIWNGTIKKIAYYPLRVTNAQLQALTS